MREKSSAISLNDGKHPRNLKDLSRSKIFLNFFFKLFQIY